IFDRRAEVKPPADLPEPALPARRLASRRIRHWHEPDRSRTLVSRASLSRGGRATGTAELRRMAVHRSIERGRTMAQSWNRRVFLSTSAAGLVSSALGANQPTRGAEISKETFTYKTVGKCPIKADVYNAGPGESRPLAVWIHGGALIMGDRRGI